MKELKTPDPLMQLDEAGEGTHSAYVKAVDRIFKRIDDGTIFPAELMDGVYFAVNEVFASLAVAKGGRTLSKACSSRVMVW